MEFLSNPAWQLLMNLGIGFLTIIVSVLIFRKQQTRRGLNYEIISDTPILSIKAEVKDKVQILFDNKPVNHVRLDHYKDLEFRKHPYFTKRIF